MEIKSSERIDEVEVRELSRVADAIQATSKIYVSRDPVRNKIGDVHCMSWMDFLRETFAQKQ